jgi:ATP-dependent DNA ligase
VTTTAPIIRRPSYESASIADARRWHWQAFHLSEKKDGIWQQREFCGSIILGEAMKNGNYYAFDVAIAFEQDVRQMAWTERREALLEIACGFPAGMSIVPEGHGAEFIEAVLRDRGEGIIAKPWAAPFGVNWIKVKRTETFDALVTELNHARGSIRLAGPGGEDYGWCPCRAQFDRVRLSDVVEIEAYDRHASGKLRTARFKRIRRDKTEVTA